MSDSEDDFMSDKFLIEAPVQAKSYTARRDAQALKSHRAGQAKNKIPLAQLEKERRQEGLSTSLFEKAAAASGENGVHGSGTRAGAGSSGGASTSGAAAGGNKAMEMMMKMGWKMGEGLGRRRTPSPPPAKRARLDADPRHEDDDQDDQELPRGGLGSRPAISSATSSRTEPLRISLWSGRKGLTARPPSPPPLPKSRDPDALDPKKLKRLEGETEGFRERQRREFTEREVERKEGRARAQLVGLDAEKGVKITADIQFHPLHILPSDPLDTIPKPLLRRIYPAQIHSPSPSPSRSSRSPSPALEVGAASRHGGAPVYSTTTIRHNISAAEKLREQMRRDMLSELGGAEGGDVSFAGALRDDADPASAVKKEEAGGEELREEDMDWDGMVDGAKRVLSMDPATHLQYLVSQLRNEHLFCFWCAFKYGSYEEMDGPGGCPGEEEDDH